MALKEASYSKRERKAASKKIRRRKGKALAAMAGREINHG